MDRYAIAAFVAVMFMSSTLITPLYGLYRGAFHFSEITLTLVYAVYVVGNLAALLFLGRLSDEIGRRRVALPALGLAGVGTLFFLFATNTAFLYWGRILSGLAIGLASGTGAAWLTEIYTSPHLANPHPREDARPLPEGEAKKVEQARATLTATSANFTGLAIGPLLAGALVQYAPWPRDLSFVVYLLLLAAVAACVIRARETAAHRTRSLHDISLRPRISVPPQIRARFLAPAVAAFGTFAFLGFYAALIPTLLVEELHQPNRALGGAIVSELFILSTLAMFATRGLASRTAMLGGLALLLPSLAALVLAQALGSLVILIAGTALSGIAAALGYRGSLQVINEIAPAERRAEVTSAYFVACFLGNSVPVIGVGVLTVAFSPLIASIVFACTITVFALVAAFVGIKFIPKSSS
jgi:MFS family permease